MDPRQPYEVENMNIFDIWIMLSWQKTWASVFGPCIQLFVDCAPRTMGPAVGWRSKLCRSPHFEAARGGSRSDEQPLPTLRLGVAGIFGSRSVDEFGLHSLRGGPNPPKIES
jgi:hypothetical protein